MFEMVSCADFVAACLILQDFTLEQDSWDHPMDGRLIMQLQEPEPFSTDVLSRFFTYPNLNFYHWRRSRQLAVRLVINSSIVVQTPNFCPFYYFFCCIHQYSRSSIKEF